MSSVADGKARSGGREAGVSSQMAEGGLGDNGTFKRRPARGGREPRGRGPDLNRNPELAFALFMLLRLTEDDADLPERGGGGGAFSRVLQAH